MALIHTVQSPTANGREEAVTIRTLRAPDGTFIKRPGPGRKPKAITDLKRQLASDPKAVRRAWAKLQELIEDGNMDAIRLALAYAWGAPPSAQLVDVKSDVHITIERTEPTIDATAVVRTDEGQ